FDGNLRTLVRQVRVEAEAAMAAGRDWREVVAELRPHIPVLWQRMSLPDRRRFLEHLRSYWDIHRHRLPESVARRLGQLQTEGKLRIHAGRILAMQPLEGRIAITWRPRASTETMTLIVDRVVNCTGPDYRARRSTHPLVQNLLCSGLLTSDPLELGIEVAESGEVLDTQYRPVSRLYYVGPWLRACHWEATAVPELREHVAR